MSWWKIYGIKYCIRQYFRVQIFSRIWPKFVQMLSSRELNFAILVVLSLVQIDMNQSENFRDKWFAKFTKINHLTANGLNTLFMLSAAALTHTNIH